MNIKQINIKNKIKRSINNNKVIITNTHFCLAQTGGNIEIKSGRREDESVHSLR